LLLDQSFVVGLGGLYADEILYDAGLRPDRLVSTVSTMEIRRLYRSLVEILHEATKHHGTSTDEHPFTDLHGKAGSFQDELQVWGRDGEPCRRCRGTVTKARGGGKLTYWCPSCQV
jgi:formamidopyrimidine-DNA glycosylase